VARDVRRPLALAAFAAILTLGCGPSRPQPSDSVAAQAAAGAESGAASVAADSGPMTGITGREWTLVSLDDGDDDPIEATARPVTLRLDASSGRASGYAGCNRYSGPYTLGGDSLSFGPAAMTKMACSVGMTTEQRFAAVLPLVARYALREATLELLDANGRAVATFSGH